MLDLHTGLNRRCSNISNELPVHIRQESWLLMSEACRRKGITYEANVGISGLWFWGDIDTTVLQCALNAVARRHSALRVSFRVRTLSQPEEFENAVCLMERSPVCIPGTFSQIVLPDIRVPLELIDVGESDPVALQNEIGSIFDRESHRQSDYDSAHDSAPLIRAVLIRRTTFPHLCLLMVDHIVSDAWSMRVVRRELAQQYFSLVAMRDSISPEPSLDFPSYTASHNKKLATGYFDAAIQYWTRVWVKYGPARITYRNFPLESPPQPEPSRSGAIQVLTLDAGMSRAIRALARASRVTLHMLITGVVSAVLRHNTGCDLIAFWTHFSNRAQREVQSSVGFFATSHLLGLDLTADPSWAELLQLARTAVLEASRFQDLPLESLWWMAGYCPRYFEDIPVFLVTEQDDLFEWDLLPGESLVIEPAPLPDRAGREQLIIILRENRDEILIKINYPQDRFSQAAVTTLLEDIRNALDHSTVSPNNRASECFGTSLRGWGRQDPTMGEFVIFDGGRYLSAQTR